MAPAKTATKIPLMKLRGRLHFGSMMLLCLALSGCDKVNALFAEEQEQATGYKPKKGQIERACANPYVASLVKDKIFSEAINRSPDNKEPLENFRQAVTGRIDEPLFQGHDPAIRRTECTGKILINIPPTIQKAFEKKDYLVAEVSYGVQPAEGGAAVDVTGGDEIINALVDVAVKKTVLIKVPLPKAPPIREPKLPEFSDDDFRDIPYDPPVDDGFGDPQPPDEPKAPARKDVDPETPEEATREDMPMDEGPEL
jgi:hypothetical protein